MTANAAQTLSDDDTELYARQIIVPGIGAQGQARLLASVCQVRGVGPGYESAVRYLRAAGISLHAPDGATDIPDCVVFADVDAIAAAERAEAFALRVPVVWYRCTGSTLIGGVARDASQIPPRREEPAPVPSGPLAEALQRLGGCEAAARAASLLLAWESANETFEVSLLA